MDIEAVRDVFTVIFEHLDITSLLKLQKACKYLHKQIETLKIIEKKFQKLSTFQPSLTFCPEAWKKAYFHDRLFIDGSAQSLDFRSKRFSHRFWRCYMYDQDSKAAALNDFFKNTYVHTCILQSEILINTYLLKSQHDELIFIKIIKTKCKDDDATYDYYFWFSDTLLNLFAKLEHNDIDLVLKMLYQKDKFFN
jgi:hypothetical protein